MSTSVYFLTICLPLLTVLVVFGMKYFASIQQAKVSLTREHAWQQMAQVAQQAQQHTAAELQTIKMTLTGLDDQVTEIGRILKQVE